MGGSGFLLGSVSKLGLLEACQRFDLRRKRKTYSMGKMTMIQTMVEIMKMERKSHILEHFGRENL